MKLQDNKNKLDWKKLQENSNVQITLIILISILPIIRFLFIPIFNEDYLVLSWLSPHSLLECFQDFHIRTTGGPYWRPAVWSSYFITKFIFGYSELPYHLTNILFYSSIHVILYKIFLRIGIQKQSAFLSLILFAVLPSHELIYGWIPGRTDLFMTFFLLVSVLFYLKSRYEKKYYIISAFAFLLSILSKETAFAGVILPVLLLLVENRNERNIKKTFFSTLTALSITILVLAYRFTFIGGTPFESSNFDSFGIVGIIKNLIIYLPLSFINAELLERCFYLLKSNIITFSIISFLILIFGIYKRNGIKFIFKSDNNRILFGLLWFVSLILPALPTLMQWYMFAASIGLFIIISEILTKINSRTIQAFIFILAIIGGLYSNDRAGKWIDASKKTNIALLSLKNQVKYNDEQVILLGAPDKICRINSMKIGIQEAVRAKTGNNLLEADAPIRCDYLTNSKIQLFKNKNHFLIAADNVRYFKPFSKSTSIFKNESFNYCLSGITFNIVNFSNGKSKVEFVLDSLYSKNIFYFDGKSFVKIN